MEAGGTLLTLLLVLTLGLIIPELFKKFRVPFLTLIILAGAITGPYGLDYVQLDETISFFGFLGMAFLMFMAGLETDITKIYSSKLKIFLMASLNSIIPFLVGLGLLRFFGYSWDVSILVGIIFISSSVAVVVSSLRENKSIPKDVSQLILSAVMVVDVVSLVALGLVFQVASRTTIFPLPVYLLVLIVSIFLLFKVIPLISKNIMKRRFFQDDGHERRLRFIIVVLVGVVAYFSFLGAHPIIASFLAGLSLSGVVLNEKSQILKFKLHTIGYGLFIPVFFFVVGMEINIFVLSQFDLGSLLMISLVLGLIISKFSSGYLAGRVVNFSHRNAMLFGSISITQLTTTLAVTYASASLGLLDSVLTTSIVILSVLTTLIGPTLSSYISRARA